MTRVQELLTEETGDETGIHLGYIANILVQNFAYEDNASAVVIGLPKRS